MHTIMAIHLPVARYTYLRARLDVGSKLVSRVKSRVDPPVKCRDDSKREPLLQQACGPRNTAPAVERIPEELLGGVGTSNAPLQNSHAVN